MSHAPPPRPWFADGELTSLARHRHARRHESAMRMAEWQNIAAHIAADVAAGASYPADVIALIAQVDQLCLWSMERAA